MPYSYRDDPDLVDRVFDLLDEVFPGLRGVAANARALGAPWESVSTPFLAFENERVVSHVGVIGLPLVILEKRVEVGTVHAVATHPEHRRQGLYRKVMDELLEFCDGSYETLILTTEHPEYFEPFGFRRLQEKHFRVPWSSSGGADGFRMLDPGDAGDVAVLQRLLETRAPVSDVVGVVGEKAVFCFNEGRNPLPYCEDLDVIVCMERDGPRLDLYDVVGETIPPLSDLLDNIPGPVSEVAVHFSADRLGLAAAVEPTPCLFEHDGPSYLMARGPFAAEGHAFTLPRSART
jgi:predicted N-acetyltransferase YhbS